MTEPIENIANQSNEVNVNIEDTTPLEKAEVTIPIKFNKEVREITILEATNLAQKGMKYDLISKDYEEIRNLSRKNGKSVAEFIEQLKSEGHTKRVEELKEKCGGDESLAHHIAELENIKGDTSCDSFAELREFFPELKSPEDLPSKVCEAANLKGTLLLDEYLRYLLEEKRNDEKALLSKKQGEKASIGSQLNRKGKVTPEANEFLRGLWK